MSASQPSADALRQRDLRCLWHPYTRINDFEKTDFPVIVRGEGACLVEAGGRRYWDGISSWWCACLGHGHPRIVEAIQRQAAVLQHSILGGMSHPLAIELADRLTAIAPRGLTRAYFASDGSSVVEASIRMAVQSFHNQGRPEKKGLIALADAYHGDTLGAVGAGFLESFHAPIRHLLNRAPQAPSPHCFACAARGRCDLRCFEGMRRLVEEQAATTAAVIVEPLVQGSAGMRIYPAEYLRQLRDLCDRHDVLLIADEIAVGFGRTGRMFACDHAGIVPDFLCLGKGLAAGALPLSAVLTTEAVFDAFRDTPGQDRTFYHGHTYCGNPIAAAAAVATLEVFADEAIVDASGPLQRRLAEGFASFGDMPGVDRWAAFGAIGVVRLQGGADVARKAARRAMDLGLLIRPLGDILYLCPPLTVTPGECDTMLELFELALRGGMDTGASPAPTREIAE